MPLIVHIEADVPLDDWMTKEQWEVEFNKDLPALVEDLLMDDPTSFLDAAGGLASIVKSAEWRD